MKCWTIFSVNAETKVVANLIGIYPVQNNADFFSCKTHIVPNINIIVQSKKEYEIGERKFFVDIPISLSCLKNTCYEILCFFRISSIHIPLVNLTNLCKKFGTCWHTCAITCAKSTIFQICLYDTKLNGNNQNCIYNFCKFKLFPFVSA